MKLNNRQLICATLAVFALFVLSAQAWKKEAQSLRQPTNLNQTRAYQSQAAWLCRAIDPRVRTVQMTTDEGRSSYYSLKCQDAKGTRLANFVWDIETGQLCMATVLEGARPTARTGGPLDSAKAVR